MLTMNKHNNVVSVIISANKYSVIGKFFTLMQGIGRLYEDRVMRSVLGPIEHLRTSNGYDPNIINSSGDRKRKG